MTATYHRRAGFFRSPQKEMLGLVKYGKQPRITRIKSSRQFHELHETAANCRQVTAIGVFLISLLALSINIPAAQNVVSPAVSQQAALPSFAPSPAIQTMMAQVQQSTLYTYVGQLSGEIPVLVGGVPYSILSRNTISGDGIQKATQFAYEYLQSIGLSASYHYWSGCGNNRSISNRNVIGEKVGVTLPNEVVVIMAHLDSMPAGSLSFGADDDASGSAGVLVAADILGRRKFQRTIRFILTTGEEQGLCGSQAYAAMARDRNENIVAVYNLDMIGWDSDNRPTLRLHIRKPDRPGYADDLAIADVFAETVSTYGLNLIPIITADYSYTDRNADQVPFWDYGYPATLAIEDTQDDFNKNNYHTLNDRLETLNLSYLTNYVRASVGTIAQLAHVSNSTVELTLSDGGASGAATAGSSGFTQAGYADATVASGANPYGVAVFSFNQNGVVVSEAAVPSSPPTTSARVFVDYRSAVAVAPGGAAAGTIDINTGLAVVNCGTAAANVTFTLRHWTGATLATGHATVARGAHFAKFINQLKAVAPDFNIPGDFPTVTQFGSLDITSDQPLSILALRLTVNQREETLLTSTPIADLTNPLGNMPLYFPQFVDGGGYITTLILLNTSDASETGKLNLFSDTGAPLVVNQVGGTRDSTFTYSIQPGGVFVFQTDGFPADANVGSAQLVPDANTSSPVGAGVISFSQQGVQVTESGVPAATPTTHARIYIDQSGNHSTGLAIANPGSPEISVTLRTYQTDGSTPAGTGTNPVNLNGNGHTAGFVPQLVSGLPANFTGVLDISSSSPFAALTLRSLTNSRGNFLLAAFPIADATQPAPSPLVFPQIADGGGYKTEFILLSVAGPSSTTLKFYGEDGSPLYVSW